MRLLVLVPLLWGTLVSSGQAFDSLTEGTVKTLYVSSKITSTPFERRLLASARDDAASFVASAGRIRTARLEAALRGLRAREGLAARDDLQLARTLLSSVCSPKECCSCVP